jgi:hypothetical protein
MTSGGLLARTLYELVFVDAGFDTAGIIRIDGLGNRFNGYVDLDSAPATLSRSQVISRLATMPDLHGITVWRGTDATMPGELARWSVQPNFFDVLSIPIVAGRGLVNGDGPSVAVINEAMARRFFDGRMPVGAEILVEGATPRRSKTCRRPTSWPMSLRAPRRSISPFVSESSQPRRSQSCARSSEASIPDWPRSSGLRMR